MKTKYLISAILLVLVLSGFIGCDLLKKKVDKHETSVYTLNAAGKTRIKIKNISGDIKVYKSKDTLKTVKITAVKTGKVKQQDLDKPLENIKINIDTVSDVISLETEIQQEKSWFKKSAKGEVDYDISIPENMKLSVDDINGDLIFENISGDIDAQLINGRVYIDGCPGNLIVNLVNGEVAANIDSTKGMKVDIVNGRIKLGRMKNVSADIYASTVNGKVKFDELTLKNVTSDKRSVRGTLGDGKNIIKLSSVNSSITLTLMDVMFKKEKRKNDDHFEGLQFDLNFDDDEDNKNTSHHENNTKDNANDSAKNKIEHIAPPAPVIK